MADGPERRCHSLSLWHARGTIATGTTMTRYYSGGIKLQKAMAPIRDMLDFEEPFAELDRARHHGAVYEQSQLSAGRTFEQSANDGRVIEFRQGRRHLQLILHRVEEFDGDWGMRPGGGIFQDSEQLWIKRDWAFSDDPRLSWRDWLVYERFSGHVMPEQCRHGRLSG